MQFLWVSIKSQGNDCAEYKGSVALQKVFPSLKCLSVHQWWGGFTGREGRTLWEDTCGNDSKRSALCYRRIPVFQSVTEIAACYKVALVLRNCPKSGISNMSINTKLLDHSIGFTYTKAVSGTFLKIARQKGKPLEDVQGSTHGTGFPG